MCPAPGVYCSRNISRYLYTLKPENNYTTRSQGVVLTPLCRTQLKQFSISFRASHLWNKEEMILLDKERPGGDIIG